MREKRKYGEKVRRSLRRALSTRENVWRRNADLIPRNSSRLRKAIKKKRIWNESEGEREREEAHGGKRTVGVDPPSTGRLANGSTENYIKCDPSRAEARANSD